VAHAAPPPGEPKRILGIDPGTRFLGWGVVAQEGPRGRALDYGVLRADPRQELPQRLVELARGLRSVIADHRPHEAAIEEAFHGRDARAALRLGEGRGAILLVLAEAGLSVTGYANNVVKRALTGAGRASKERVAAMVTRLLGLEAPPDRADASDALALALCHLQRGAIGTESGGIPPRLAEAIRAAQRRGR
jgi:crossover junction endodeoxyribonuclease RuvC